MRNKIGHNYHCPCGSGKIFKKGCLIEKQDDGIHIWGSFETPSLHELEIMTKEYQEMVRNSPLWDEMVKQNGEKGAEILLKEFQVKFK